MFAFTQIEILRRKKDSVFFFWFFFCLCIEHSSYVILFPLVLVRHFLFGTVTFVHVFEIVSLKQTKKETTMCFFLYYVVYVSCCLFIFFSAVSIRMK
jgi:hypothetical protein